MNTTWEYLEHIREIVYAIDIETDELLYMNRYGKEQFSVKEPDGYRGHKCYKLLQGLSEPCPFCNRGSLLQEGAAQTAHHNAVLNRTLLLKESLMLWEGRKCRLEIAFHTEEDAAANNGLLRYNTLINDCLRESRSATDPEESLGVILRAVGERLECRRVDVYERSGEQDIVRTGGWSRDGHISAGTSTRLWENYVRLSDCSPLLITSGARTGTVSPELASFLDLRDGEVSVLMPLVNCRETGGFLVLNGSAAAAQGNVMALAQLLSHFIASVLGQRQLLAQLTATSCHDQLTGAWNRQALDRVLAALDPERPLGLVQCDIIGLKSVNDLHGYHSGDRLIRRAYEVVAGAFSPDEVFRVGGDEFLVVTQSRDEGQFEIQVDVLRRRARVENCNLSIGSAWTAAEDGNFQLLLRQTDERMYAEKQAFYNAHDPQTSQLRRRQRNYLQEARDHKEENDPFRLFLQQNYFDSATFFLSMSAESAPSYFYCGDMQKNLFYISDQLKEDFNFDSNLVYDFVTLLEQRIYQEDQKRHQQDWEIMLREKKSYHSISYRVYDQNMELRWVHCQGRLQWSEDRSMPLFFSGFMSFLSDQDSADPIIGTQGFSKILEKMRARAGAEKELRLICFSLTNFEAINFVLGRQKGDTIIWTVTDRVEKGLGEEFKLIRLEGPRFIAVTASQVQVDDICRTIREIIRDVYIRNQVPFFYPCSIGVLRSPRDGVDAQELLEKAFSVLRAAVDNPTKIYLEFAPKMAESYQKTAEMSLALNQCVNRQFDGFRIVVQPQVRASDGRISGGEVLLRWRNRGKDVSPAEFIPVLERSGLIILVGKWVVAKSIQLCRELRTIKPDFVLSFNVSYQQIMDKEFFPFIKRMLEAYDVPGENLLIELTESNFDEAPETLDTFLKQCRSIGIHFAMDDFGTAYSNLQMLFKHPADLIKLDRSLVQEAMASDDKMNFLHSIIYCCRRSGKRVCVEGVEVEEELSVICQTECDYIQGFYFYRPMEIDALLRELREHGADGIGND